MKRGMMIAAVLGAAALLGGCSGQKGGVAATTAADTAAATTAEETGKETEPAADTFTVGFDQDFPPMGFVGDNGEYTGFDLELAQEVANRLGRKFVPQPIAWDAKDMELESGNIDCIWNGFTITGREDGYTWTRPYMENSQVFVVGKDSGIKTLADLSGKVVEVQADSSAEKALQADEKLSGTFGTLQTTPDYNTAFMDLEMGAVDAIAMDVIVAGYQIEQRKADFIILDEALAAEEYGVGFKKGNDALKDQVQEQLDAMAADGTLEKISEKWFGKDVTTVNK
jgi:polar amino acid transport system substrate-binding protein